MTVAEVLLLDFDIEAESTRQVLERVPVDKADWKPHEKSFALGQLASHVSTLATFGLLILTTEEVDIATLKFPVHKLNSTEELLKNAAGFAAEIRTTLAAMSDEDLMATWTMRFRDHVVTAGPRATMYRTLFFNHLIHHRGQLNVYLRELDIKVPGLYGPSADEPFAALNSN